MTALATTLALLMAGVPSSSLPLRTFDEIRFEGVSRQSAEPSCATASIATLMQMRRGVHLSEAALWQEHLARLSDADLEITLANGLSIGDIRRILLRLGQPTDAVRISLLDLARTGEPAIVHLERRGAQPFRHFVVFEALEGTTVVLRDPAYGLRRIQIAAFMRHWTGVAVFLRP